jgi:hypothetical protein
MMEQLKNYFFNKAIENAKQSITSDKSSGKKQLLCVMDVDDIDSSKLIQITNDHFKKANYEIYYLFHWSKLSEKMEGVNVHFYSNKKVTWFGSISKLKEYECLDNQYDLVIYPQPAYRKDFDFVSKVVKATLQIGSVENLDKYDLDLALDCQSNDLSKFYKQLKDYFPRLFSIKSSSN